MDNRQMVLREIPKIDELLMDEQLIFFMETTPRAVVVDAAREVIEEIRKDALAGTRTEVPKREAIVEEICRIFRVPPHMVQDLQHATYSNIEHQSIDFVVHTLTPWLVRFEQAVSKDLLLEEEQDEYFTKFNVDGLLRGDYQSRMNGYATGISNGFLSPNDIHRLENMDLIPAEEGGDDYYLNGGYVKLKDAGKFADAGQASTPQNEPAEEPDEEEKPADPEGPQEDQPDSENRQSESMPKKKERRTIR